MGDIYIDALDLCLKIARWRKRATKYARERRHDRAAAGQRLDGFVQIEGICRQSIHDSDSAQHHRRR